MDAWMNVLYLYLRPMEGGGSTIFIIMRAAVDTWLPFCPFVSYIVDSSHLPMILCTLTMLRKEGVFTCTRMTAAKKDVHPLC